LFRIEDISKGLLPLFFKKKKKKKKHKPQPEAGNPFSVKPNHIKLSLGSNNGIERLKLNRVDLLKTTVKVKVKQSMHRP
jgi:hypothetical protein